MSSMEVSFQLYLNIKVACNSMHFFSGKLSWENIKTVEKPDQCSNPRSTPILEMSTLTITPHMWSYKLR
jgi:hypothetical protein